MLRPTFDFYQVEHRGKLDEDAFFVAEPLAVARLEAITGHVDEGNRNADRWLHAACAMVDRVAGGDASGTVASETVGSTSVTYAQAAQMSREEADYRAVLPWLAGTGLLCQAL